MLYLRPDMGYGDLPLSTNIPPMVWSAFIAACVKNSLSLLVKHYSHLSQDTMAVLEGHNISPEAEEVIMTVEDDIMDKMRDVCRQYDGYPEVQIVRVGSGLTITAVADRRVLDWHEGKGKANPSPLMSEPTQAQEFQRALNQTTFSRASNDPVKPPWTAAKATTPPRENSETVMLTTPTVFVDKDNASMAPRGFNKVVADYNDNNLYTVSGSVSVFGNWSGAGDVFVTLQDGECFEVGRDSRVESDGSRTWLNRAVLSKDNLPE